MEHTFWFLLLEVRWLEGLLLVEGVLATSDTTGSSTGGGREASYSSCGEYA